MVVFVYQGYRDTIDKFHGRFDTIEEAENHIYEDLVKEVQDFLDKMQQKRNGTYVSPMTQKWKDDKESIIERKGLEFYETTLSTLEEGDNRITEDGLKSEKYYQNRDWKGEFKKVSQTPKGSIQQSGSWSYDGGNPPMYQGYSQRYEEGSGNYPYIVFDTSFSPSSTEMKAEGKEYTEKEIRKTAQHLAQALTIIEGKKCYVHGFKFLNNLASFDISLGGIDYDGGSYVVRKDGKIVNIAIRNSPSYAKVGDTVNTIVNKIVSQDMVGSASRLRKKEDPFAQFFVNKMKNDEGGFDALGHLFNAEYSMLGGIREEFKDAESNLSEATLKRLRKTYDEYEDRNEHMSNYLLLATFFGTDKDKEEVKKIMARRNRRGYLTQKESTWLYENINPYYDHLRNVKAAETFEARYNQNGTIAYNEKEWAGDLGNERGAVFLGSDGKDKYYYIHKRIVKVVKGLKNETLVQPVIDFNDYRLDDLIDETDERRKLAKIFDEVMKNYDRHTEYRRAETFNVEFNEWADQEMLTHGQDISFRDWAKEEGEKHGDMDLTDWAKDEEESHDERYGAETFGAETCPKMKWSDEDMKLKPCGKPLHWLGAPQSSQIGQNKGMLICGKCAGSEQEAIGLNKWMNQKGLSDRLRYGADSDWNDDTYFTFYYKDSPEQNKRNQIDEEYWDDWQMLEDYIEDNVSTEEALNQYRSLVNMWGESYPHSIIEAKLVEIDNKTGDEKIIESWKANAENFGAESKKTKYGMIAAGVITAFALLPEIKKRF